MDRATILEARIKRGEEYMEAHPDDAKSKKLYWDVVAEYVALKEAEEREQDITAVTLDLPDGVAWSRTKDDPPNRRVRIILRGFPREADELSLDDLAALNQTMRTKEEVMPNA